MVYDIALGAKRTATSVQQQYQWEWPEIVKRLKDVVYTQETMRQYSDMTKAQRVEVKDVGFFIGGLVAKRKVSYRQLLVIDIDEADVQTLKSYTNGCTVVNTLYIRPTVRHRQNRVIV